MVTGCSEARVIDARWETVRMMIVEAICGSARVEPSAVPTGEEVRPPPEASDPASALRCPRHGTAGRRETNGKAP